jgi:hypothetical protein
MSELDFFYSSDMVLYVLQYDPEAYIKQLIHI